LSKVNGELGEERVQSAYSYSFSKQQTKKRNAKVVRGSAGQEGTKSAATGMVNGKVAMSKKRSERMLGANVWDFCASPRKVSGAGEG